MFSLLRWPLILGIILFNVAQSNAKEKDSFYEELFLKPLTSGHLYAYFQFTTLWDTESSLHTLRHTHLFPRALGEIIGRHDVDEMHVTLTEGLWNYEKWGYPHYDAGTGAEVFAWFNKNVTNVDDSWKSFTNALAGLICASLNFVGPSNSISPVLTFSPTGALKDTVNFSHFRYSSLPREIVCTENLTPFKKLLPCDAKKGLATLLNSVHIHNTHYHSLGIHFRSVCQNSGCTRTSLELRQTISLVYDAMSDTAQDWSVRRLFGMGIKGACPLASSSKVYVDVTTNGTSYTYSLSPPSNTTIISLRGGQRNEIVVYDVNFHSRRGMFSVALSSNTPRESLINIPTILFVNRYLNGYGQEKGSIITSLHNNHWQPLHVVILQNIPWYLSVYMHTMKITCNGKTFSPLVQKYVPGRQRMRPHQLELIVSLPPHSITKISIDLEYSFLKWQEYPPDANHGFYMGPAIITALLPIARNYTALPLDGSTITSCFNASRDGYLVQLRTESLLISLPTPDFSMPYNVICLACTAVALAFGPLHNISTKRLLLRRVKGDWKKKIISVVKSCLTRKSEKWRTRDEGKWRPCLLS
ncbi:GPI transamidase component PIG-T [Orussus abietinus]|uniref:GPI transamidase component PIG-T n=1 Tax=Orussus abietinus TaxID=222816 RepID=UPI0006260386|nr:GPI transamidase component PIG-T [Orussus abietinus]XP_023287716.1 GPI transamidase component PIG-T [Orussus abietinus]